MPGKRPGEPRAVPRRTPSRRAPAAATAVLSASASWKCLFRRATVETRASIGQAAGINRGLSCVVVEDQADKFQDAGKVGVVGVADLKLAQQLGEVRQIVEVSADLGNVHGSQPRRQFLGIIGDCDGPAWWLVGTHGCRMPDVDKP